MDYLMKSISFYLLHIRRRIETYILTIKQDKRFWSRPHLHPKPRKLSPATGYEKRVLDKLKD